MGISINMNSNLTYYFQTLRLIGGRYFIIEGIAFLIFYVFFHKKMLYKKIQGRFPQTKDYLREMGYSVITIGIFALVPLVILRTPAIARYTFFYTNINQHSWWYFFLAFPLMFILHDTYFYCTHRLMHNK